MSAPRHSEAYLRGFAAWHNGGDWRDSPYDEVLVAAMDWREGWLFARRYAATLRAAEDAGLELPVT